MDGDSDSDSNLFFFAAGCFLISDGGDDDEVLDWWNFPLEGLDAEGLRERRDAISEARAKIAAVLRERHGEASGSGSGRFPPPPPPPPPSGDVI